MLFSSLLGNSAAKVSLAKMLENKKVPQVLLLSGPKGIGKFLFAKEIAGRLIGDVSRTEKENHPDLHIYTPEGKLHLHSMASMQAVLEESQLPPFESPCKVFIIDDVENMLPSSSNALLKTLEEPYAGIYYILLTSNPRQVLPTIRSRAQKVMFFPIPKSEIAEYFKKKEISQEDAAQAAEFSDGSMQIAEFYLKEKALKEKMFELLHEKSYSQFVKLVQEREKELEAIQDESPELYKQKIDFLFACILYWYRDQTVEKTSSSEKPFYSKTESVRQIQEVTLEKAFELIYKAKQAVFQNVKCKTALEELFFQLHIL